MKKITLQELRESENWTRAVIVFTEDSFSKPYNEKERSYYIFSSANYFKKYKLGNSLNGYCLDGFDDGVRLDVYMHQENGWKVEYCYIVE